MSDAIKDLIAAQQSCGKLVKNARNPHFKNNYADIGATLDVALDALHKHNFALIQHVVESERGSLLRTTFAHVSGATFDSDIPLVLKRGDMQDLGSAITYARRYSIQSMLGLAAEDDDGQRASHQKGTAEANISSQPPKRVSAAADF